MWASKYKYNLHHYSVSGKNSINNHRNSCTVGLMFNKYVP